MNENNFNLLINSTLQNNKYLVQQYISSGGFGCTYIGMHVMLKRQVCIKEFFVKDFCNRDKNSSQVSVGTLSKRALVDKLKNKFIEEARSLSEMSHPNIVHVSDVFEENGTAYYVMNYINGKSLGDLVKQNGALPEARVLKYIRQIISALKYVHANNRLHLDIKPSNIMIDSNDNAILIDFGASKQYDEEAGENTSTLMGRTPGFAPIEQMGNDVRLFMPATDIYALGATMYNALTGLTPLDSNVIASGEELQPLPDGISESTRNTVKAAMQLRKADRPQNMQQFEALLDAKPSAKPKPQSEKTEIVSSQNDKTHINPQLSQQQSPQPPVDTPNGPDIPGTPGVPGVPGVPDVPGVPSNPAAPYVYDEPNRPAKKKHTWMWLLLAVLGLALIGGGVYYYMEYGQKTKSSKVKSSKDKEEENEDDNPGNDELTYVSDTRMTDSDGDAFTYTGDVTLYDGKTVPHGNGKAVYGDFVYTGQFQYGKMSGQGRIDWDDGSYYEGTFANDSFDEGVLVSDNQYHGSFRNNAPWNGTLYDADGNYLFEYVNGEATNFAEYAE